MWFPSSLRLFPALGTVGSRLGLVLLTCMSEAHPLWAAIHPHHVLTSRFDTDLNHSEFSRFPVLSLLADSHPSLSSSRLPIRIDRGNCTWTFLMQFILINSHSPNTWPTHGLVDVPSSLYYPCCFPMVRFTGYEHSLKWLMHRERAIWLKSTSWWINSQSSPVVQYITLARFSSRNNIPGQPPSICHSVSGDFVENCYYAETHFQRFSCNWLQTWVGTQYIIGTSFPRVLSDLAEVYWLVDDDLMISSFYSTIGTSENWKGSKVVLINSHSSNTWPTHGLVDVPSSLWCLCCFPMVWFTGYEHPLKWLMHRERAIWVDSLL